MAEVALAQKKVDSALLDNWSRGQSISSLLAQKDTSGGNSIDVGQDTTGPTVVRSETGSPITRAFGRSQLIIDKPVFINSNVSPTSMAQILNGNYAVELVKADAGGFRNKIDDITVDQLLFGLAASRHTNLSLAALTKTMLSQIEAKMLTPGVRESALLWIVSPAMSASIGDLFNDVQPADILDSSDFGKIKGRSINGLPAVRNSGIPGYVRRRRGVTASSITSNVLTLTMADTDHGFVTGQFARTTGFTTNVTTAIAITSVSGVTVTMALTASNAADNGVLGFLESASAQAILIDSDRCFYGADQAIPISSLTKRTDAAGWSHQLFQNIGALALSGAVRLVHATLPNTED